MENVKNKLYGKLIKKIFDRENFKWYYTNNNEIQV